MGAPTSRNLATRALHAVYLASANTRKETWFGDPDTLATFMSVGRSSLAVKFDKGRGLALFILLSRSAQLALG